MDLRDRRSGRLVIRSRLRNAPGFTSQAGSAVGKLFDKMSGESSYASAAAISTKNAQLEALSTKIQETANARTIYKVIGQETSATAGGNFTTGGSAADVIRSSTQQGALQQALTGVQGEVNENALLQQATAYQAEGQAALMGFASSGVGMGIAAVGAIMAA